MAAKLQSESDTIAAIATPAGRGGIGVIRISGSRVQAIAEQLIGTLPEPRRAALRVFRDAEGEMLDGGLALYFPGPASYTGEDVLELHGHGGPVVLDLLLTRVVSLGARLAQPGEFSRRAFLNDKLDLTQAEAISDLIDSSSEQAARAALRSLQGEFSLEVQSLTQAVTETRMHVEAAIDFPEEELDFLADRELHDRIGRAQQMCSQIMRTARQGTLLQEGMTVVIAGLPNAGKSSLLNRLAGYAAAIVTEVPGTTRDVLRERIHIEGMPLHVIDTAGLRERADVVEAEGIRRAKAEMTRADRILYIADATRGLDLEAVQQESRALPESVPVTWVFNKSDLIEHAAGLQSSQPPILYLSATTGDGIDALREHLKQCMGYQTVDGATFSARRRHLDALTRAQRHLQEAAEQLHTHRAGELMAEELRQAQRCLAEITGEFSPDDLLGRIFANFCIGK